MFYRGQTCGAKRTYSDGLLLARLKALKPEVYREDAAPPPARPLRIVIRDFITEGEAARKAAVADTADTRSLSDVSAIGWGGGSVKP